jgi:hypothetical protein
VATGPGAGAAALPMLPESAIVRADNGAHVWRVGKDGRLAKVSVQVGERDARSGGFALQGGLAAGETVLRNPGPTLIDGQRAEFAQATKAK